jgi:tetratricopeptide (TPR) repeat protein
MTDQIFISYRRDDAAYVTGHINDLLRKEFGDEAVFTDVDNIALGVDFRAVLDTTVSQCQVLLAVIGSEWLNASDKDGHHRLQDPADFVRIEIESALKRNIPVIPLLVSGAKMPTEAELPESLRGLVFRNGTQIRPAPDFRSDMARLINNLRRHFDSIRQNEPATTVPDAGPGPESNNKPLPAESNSTQDSQSTQGEASEVMLQVGDDERVRKTAEFGQEQQSERRSTGLWRIAAAVVVVASGSWYFANQNPEAVQSVLSAVQSFTSNTEQSADGTADIEANQNSSTDSSDLTVETADEETEAGFSNLESIGEDSVAVATNGIETIGEMSDQSTAALADEVEVAITERIAAMPLDNADDEVILTPDSQRQSDVSSSISGGVRLAAVGDHEAAIESFTEAIQLGIEPAFGCKQRAASYRALEQHEAAIKDYDEAIKLNGEDVNAYYNRGASHHALQDYASAVLDYDVVIQLDPEYVTAYSRRADAHEANGNIEAALQDRAIATVFENNQEDHR